MANVTQLLDAAAAGDPRAAADLLPLVYDELRKLASARMVGEKPGHTLQATALVHEAYVRLVGGTPDRPWNGRGHFFAAAAEAMRRLLVEQARRRGRLKRGGDLHRVDLAYRELAADAPELDLLALDDALGLFAADHPEKADLVKLRFFAGMTLAEAATALGVSPSTADRHWRYARAWLARRLRPAHASPESSENP